MSGWLMWMNPKRRPPVEVTFTLSLSTQRLKCSQRCNLKKWLPGCVMYIEQSGGGADAIVHKELLVCSRESVCLLAQLRALLSASVAASEKKAPLAAHSALPAD